MIKAIRLLFLGFIGIVINHRLSLYLRAWLIWDLCHLIFFVSYLSLFERYSLDKEKTFYIRSFNYKIFYKNVYALLFLFNEIFCIGEYKVKTSIVTYVDLGSNIGLSILWYHYFNPKMSIMAFEPDGNSLQFLKKNLESNNVSKCKIYEVALTNKVSEAKFYRFDDMIQSLDNGLKLNHKLKYSTIMVQTDKLSRYIKNRHISLIKIDIEGSEYEVFDDLFSTGYLLNIEEIIFESHYFNSKQFRIYKKIISNLREYGSVDPFNNSKASSINYWINNMTRPSNAYAASKKPDIFNYYKTRRDLL